MKLNLAMAQINTILGDVPRNLEKHLDYIQKARNNGADLIIFPELSLTGYVLQDLTPTVAIHPTPSDPVFSKLLDASKSIDIIFGFVEEDSRNRFYIASGYLSAGEILHIHHKVYLPTYGLFDEGRFFAWGNDVNAFDTRFGRVGMLICEDFWHASLPYLLWLDGADIFFFTSASPGRGLPAESQGGAPARLDSARWVDDINRAYAGLFTSFVVHTNKVGYEDGLNFWGGASVFNPDGEAVVQGPQHQEAMVLAEIDLNHLHRTRTRLPLLRDERTALVQRELIRINNGRSSSN
jgi:NAD+ synthase (glutamine-hydrolysing)